MHGPEVHQAAHQFIQASIIKQPSITIYLCLSAGQSANIDAEIARRIRMWETWDLAGRWTTGFTIGPSERSLN